MKISLLRFRAIVPLLCLLAAVIGAGCSMRSAAPATAAAPPAPLQTTPDPEPEAQVSATVELPPAEPEGKPVYIPPPQPAYNREDVIWIQQRLQELGYYGGAVDGAAGNATEAAIKSYQRDQDIEPDGRPTAELRDFMWRNGG